MTWVHWKLINTANPLDLFQLTVPARMMWDMQLTKASGWLTPHPPVSLPASLGSESNSTADICALRIWRLWVWCIAGLPSLYCNYGDGLLLLGELVQGLTQMVRGNMQQPIMKHGGWSEKFVTKHTLYSALHCCSLLVFDLRDGITALTQTDRYFFIWRGFYEICLSKTVAFFVTLNFFSSY